MFRGREERQRQAQRIEDAGESQRMHAFRGLNRWLDRYPVGAPLVLAVVGTALLLLAYKVPLRGWLQVVVLIVAGPPLVFGLLLLLVQVLRTIFAPLVALWQRLFTPYSDPAIDELAPVFNGRALDYEQGKRMMARTLAQRWGLSEEQARDKIDYLEADREIVYLPGGRWQVGPGGS